MSVLHEWFTITFPGQGNGGRDLIRKLTTKGCQVSDSDSRFLGMLISMRMMVVERRTSETSSIVLPTGTQGHEIVLKMHASKQMRDVVADYIQGRCMIDPTFWGFIVDGDYVRVHRDVSNNRIAEAREFLAANNMLPGFWRSPSPPAQSENLAQRVHRISENFNRKRTLRKQITEGNNNRNEEPEPAPNPELIQEFKRSPQLRSPSPYEPLPRPGHYPHLQADERYSWN